MGAYLSKPVIEKESTEGKNAWISYGASSMQGWRYFQEDAHNCILDFDDDENASLFAVYDGHGGNEVAEYCANKFPEFLRKVTSYVEGNVDKALEDSFLGFDATLTTPDAQTILKQLAKGDNDSDSDEDPDDDAGTLTEEANQPLESVLEKYGGAEAITSQIKAKLVGSRFDRQSFQSPLLSGAGRKRRRGDDDETGDTKEGGCSSSAAGSSSSSAVPPTDQEKNEADNDNHNKEKNTAVTNGVSSESKQSIASDHTETSEAVPEGHSKKNSVKGVSSEDDDAEDEDYNEGDELVDEKDEDDSEDDDEEEEEEDDDEEEDGDSDEEESDDEEGMMMDDKGEPGYDSGTTAVVAVITAGGKLYVGNAGDSRCILCRSGKALDLSVDHKPEEAGETKRIVAAGGTVTADGRVNGGLNLSRALGDHAYKQCENLELRDQMITPLPDVVCEQLNAETDRFMVLACDGIWNSLTSQEVVDFVSERLNKDMTMTTIIEEMFDHCLAEDTSGDGTGCDNMTCIIIRFDDLASFLSAPKGAARKHNGSEKVKVTPGGDVGDSTPAKRKKVTE